MKQVKPSSHGIDRVEVFCGIRKVAEFTIVEKDDELDVHVFKDGEVDGRWLFSTILLAAGTVKGVQPELRVQVFRLSAEVLQTALWPAPEGNGNSPSEEEELP